jgi:hypothetical protein
MKKPRKHNIRENRFTIDPNQYMALGFSTYQETKGMAYRPSKRDENKQARKQAKQDLKKYY